MENKFIFSHHVQVPYYNVPIFRSFFCWKYLQSEFIGRKVLVTVILRGRVSVKCPFKWKGLRTHVTRGYR